MQAQLALFADDPQTAPDLRSARSGTFVDNLALPIHRWFRYSAGFAAQWVEQVLSDWSVEPGHVVLDPFAGSGTVSVVCDTLGIASVGAEAHPLVSRICKAKLLWTTPPDRVAFFAATVLETRRTENQIFPCIPV